ncbi:MAG: stalk domain-containing protein, partial [Acidobacteriota bacterium]|nr:stalk domain-containing protein [Acidobacteriota bacterium]
MRTRRLLAASVSILLLAASGYSFQQPSAYTIVSREGRRPLPFRAQGGHDMVALADVAAAFGLTVREDVAAGGIVVTTGGGKTIVLTPGQPLASADGRVVTLPAPPARDGRAWLVPV